jgi:hypothetical protein
VGAAAAAARREEMRRFFNAMWADRHRWLGLHTQSVFAPFRTSGFNESWHNTMKSVIAVAARFDLSTFVAKMLQLIKEKLSDAEAAAGQLAGRTVLQTFNNTAVVQEAYRLLTRFAARLVDKSACNLDSYVAGPLERTAARQMRAIVARKSLATGLHTTGQREQKEAGKLASLAEIVCPTRVITIDYDDDACTSEHVVGMACSCRRLILFELPCTHLLKMLQHLQIASLPAFLYGEHWVSKLEGRSGVMGFAVGGVATRVLLPAAAAAVPASRVPEVCKCLRTGISGPLRVLRAGLFLLRNTTSAHAAAPLSSRSFEFTGDAGSRVPRLACYYQAFH